MSTTESEPSEVENYTEAHIREYLLRLGRHAAERLNRRTLRAMRALVEPVSASTNGREYVNDVQQMLLGPIAQARATLRDASTLGDLARALFPLESVVPRAKRENIMRSVTSNLTAHGTTMAKRWATNTAAPNIANALAERSIAALEPVRASFTRFVRSVPTFHWLITADFSIAGDGRPNDVFAYTVYPLTNLEKTIQEAQTALPRDYKDTQAGLNDQALRYLASPKIFTFVFVPERERRIIADVSEARKGIDNTIATLRALHDSERFENEIAQWKAVRQRAHANSFDYRLMENMALSATFAGVVATLLAAEGRADWVMWVPDRDDMTTAYGQILWQMFSTNAWAFTLRRRLPPIRIMYGTEDQSHPGGSPWFDPIIRVPDFVAGVVSGWDYSATRTLANDTRDKPIFQQVISDNPNLAIVVFPELKLGDIQSTLLRVSRSPITDGDGSRK